MKTKTISLSLMVLLTIMFFSAPTVAQSVKGTAIADIYGLNEGVIAENVELGLNIIGDPSDDPSFIVSGWFPYTVTPVTKTTNVQGAEIVFTVAGGNLGETTTTRCNVVLYQNGWGNAHCRTTGNPRNPL